MSHLPTGKDHSDTGIEAIGAFDTLEGLHRGWTEDRITVRHLILALGVHAFPAGIFFFAALNVVPAVPGTSLILGMPLVILCFRKLAGYDFWLPRIIMDMQIRKETLDRFHSVVRPYLNRVRIYLHPNAQWLHHPVLSRCIDLIIFFLSISVLVPLPFTAMLPALCICLMSLGLMQRDYRWVIAGSSLGFLALIIVWAVLYGSTRLITLLY